MTFLQMKNRRDRRATHGLRRHALVSSLAALLIIAGGVGHALAQDDDDDELPDVKFFRGMMRGFGLKKDGDQSGINYQERAPLVVPPTRDLPPPQSADMPRNPAWPVDQDEKRRKDAAASRRKASASSTWEDLSRQLSPNELKKGAVTARDEALSRRSAENPEQYQQQSKPSELGYVGGMFGDMKNFFSGNNKTETATFEAEPPRASLTDPPSGYRSPSAAEPYGIGPDNQKTKALSQEDRVNVGVGSTSR
jgi:hypothetical protein